MIDNFGSAAGQLDLRVLSPINHENGDQPFMSRDPLLSGELSVDTIENVRYRPDQGKYESMPRSTARVSALEVGLESRETVSQHDLAEGFTRRDDGQSDGVTLNFANLAKQSQGQGQMRVEFGQE